MSRTTTATILSAAVLASAPAFGDDIGDNDAEIEEIVVTATFRSEDLNRVPSSIDVLDADTIAARSATHLDDLLGAIPNLNFAKGASRARFLQLRGIGERGQFDEPLNSSVGLIVDSVDLSGIGTVAGLFDVEQVEVLRGPQGTLYGANALAGLVNVVTNAPTELAEGRVEVSAGTYGAYGVGAVASGPLSDRVRGRVAVRIDESNGFIDNDYLGRDDTDNTRDRTLRGKLSWDVSTATVVDLAAGVLDAENGYDAFSLDNVRTTLTDQPGRDIQETVYGTAAIRWHGNDAFTARAHLGIATSDIAYGYDADWVHPGFHPDGYAGTDEYLRDRSTLTAQARLVSKPGRRVFNDSTDWTAGVYLFKQDVDLLRRSDFIPRDFTSAFGIDRLAFFGQIETALGNDAMLTVGLRLERHSSEYQNNDGIAFAPDDNLAGGRIALSRQLTEGAAAYGSVSRGYKAGGFNISGTLPADLLVYDPETLWNYEAGIKAQSRDGRLRGRVALFRMQRVDVQIESSLVRRPADDGAEVEFIQYVGNAAEGSNQGLELDLQYDAGNALLFARAGLLDTEYQDYITGDGEDFDGRDQAHAPRYQLNAGLEFSFGASGNYYARIEAEARDDFYFSDNHNFKSKAYQLVHASAGYRGPNWSVRAWGRNLADEDYFVRGFFFGNDPRDGYTGRGFTQLGDPRHLGVTVSVAW